MGNTEFYGVVAQAQDMVPGFKESYRKFEQQVVLRGLSKGLLTNYGRNMDLHLHIHYIVPAGGIDRTGTGGIPVLRVSICFRLIGKYISLTC